MAEQGRNSGGDLFDMAKDGTTVPEDAAVPRHIKSVPRPGEAAQDSDPNAIGGTTLAEAATNAADIPRSNRDTENVEVTTGTGDALPSQIASKRLHNVPGGVTHDPTAKGSTRYTAHSKQDADEDKGAQAGHLMEQAPGDEDLTAEQATDKYERKEL